MTHSPEHQPELQGDLNDEEATVKPGWLESTPFWAVSATLHFVLVLIIISIPLAPTQAKKQITPIAIKMAPKEQTVYRPEVERDVIKRPEILTPEKIKKPIVMTQLEPVVVELSSKGDPEKHSDVKLDNISLTNAIGAGGPPPGIAGRLGPAARSEGDGWHPKSESAVRAALEWLKRHQHPDGHWSAAEYTKQCTKTCRSDDHARYGDDKAFAEHDVGVTALAMLAFTGFGQTHRDGEHPEYVECLRKAAVWLKSQQTKSDDPATHGRYGSGDHEQWIYDHAIATMAMGELLIMSNDTIGLKRTVRDAAKLCLRSQNDGHGWRYGLNSGQNDTSVTGWMVLALKTTKNARLGIEKAEYDRAFRGALTWFDRATASSGKCGYMVPGDEGSRLADGVPDPYPHSKQLSCMTAVSVLCRLFGGEKRTEQSIRRGVGVLLQEPPRWREQKGRSLGTVNMYYWYYASYALFQFGGKEWKTWNKAMLKTLLETQRRGGDEDGSWDPIGEWGIAGGRVYSTALGAMTLEVYYRFTRNTGERY